MFCEAHAGEYNKNWNYFAGLTAEEAAKRAADEASDAFAYRQSAHYGWAGPGDGSRSRDEMRALDVLELEADADFKAVKASYRRLAKEHHPDRHKGDRKQPSASMPSRLPMTFCASPKRDEPGRSSRDSA